MFRRWRKKIVCVLLLVVPSLTATSFLPPPSDPERLGMALEYFTSRKYSEALLIFIDLDNHYKLNPRFHAYMGMCYYYEWDYEKACEFIDNSMPELGGLAPHERSLYHYISGESHFNLQQYNVAIPQYKAMLPLCYEKEKAQVYYRLGMCYMLMEDWQAALDNYQLSLLYYGKYPDLKDSVARMAQLQRMVKGCQDRLPKPEPPSVETDSIAQSLMADSIAQPMIIIPADTDSIDLRQIYEQKINVKQ